MTSTLMCKKDWSTSSLPCWQNCPANLEHPSSRRSLSPCLWSALHGDAELAWLHSLGPLPVLRYSLISTQGHLMSSSVTGHALPWSCTHACCNLCSKPMCMHSAAARQMCFQVQTSLMLSNVCMPTWLMSCFDLVAACLTVVG